VSRLELDHVVIAAADLDAAARELETRHGLASVLGGRHPDWGTANRIVPLGDAYLELIAVVDEATVARTVPGRWVLSAEAGQPLGWAVHTDDLDAIAGRLGLTPSAGSRVTPDGEILRWRSAGLERVTRSPGSSSKATPTGSQPGWATTPSPSGYGMARPRSPESC
jgi:Glyoxalase-like domain